MISIGSTQVVAVREVEKRLPLHLLLLIVALAFSAFLTETKFLPLKHNVGVFEVVAVVLSLAAFAYFVRQDVPLRFHRVMLPLFLIVIVAGLSNYQLMSVPPDRVSFRVLSFVILVVSFFLVLVWYNLFLHSEQSLDLFLRAVTVSAAVIASWVLLDQIASGGAVGAAGPFRNRAHAGIYMHTAFWLMLVNANWPRSNRLERWLTYPVVAMSLYVVAASGRRSVYIALAIGLVGLSMGVLAAGPQTRRRIATLLMVSTTALAVVYFEASEFWKPAAFFKTRVGMVGERVETFSGLSDVETEHSFVLLQRQGGLRAFSEHPVLGIGLGGFPKSEYSPTGHEMHSTPMRFLAELGITGILLYAWFMLEVVAAAFRAWWANRRGPYEAASLILLIAVLSLSVSYVYNRQMTDRTFWLLLVLGIALDTWTIRRERTAQFRDEGLGARWAMSHARVVA